MTPNGIVVHPDPAMFMSSMQSLVTSRSCSRISNLYYIRVQFTVTSISPRWSVWHWISTMASINPELRLHVILRAGSDMLGGPVGHAPGTRSPRATGQRIQIIDVGILHRELVTCMLGSHELPGP